MTFGWDLTAGTQTAQVTETLKQTSPVLWWRKYLCCVQPLGWLRSTGRELKSISVDGVNKSAACQVGKEKRHICFVYE